MKYIQLDKVSYSFIYDYKVSYSNKSTQIHVIKKVCTLLKMSVKEECGDLQII